MHSSCDFSAAITTEDSALIGSSPAKQTWQKICGVDTQKPTWQCTETPCPILLQLYGHTEPATTTAAVCKKHLQTMSSQLLHADLFTAAQLSSVFLYHRPHNSFSPSLPSLTS